MADNQLKTSLGSLTAKQKVIGAVTVIVIIFLIYEIIQMFSGGSTTPPPAPVPAAKPHPMNAMNANGPAAPTPTPGMAPNAAPAAPAAPQVATVNALTSPKDNQALRDQADQQKMYLDSLNQLQLLKIKREIAETNQAIATARLATETANKNMSDLLTQPAPVSLPASAYTNKLMGGVTVGPAEGSIQQPKAAVQQVVTETPYVVISVSMEFHRWSAVLGNQGKLYNVSIGDVLPDGDTVGAISRDGVVLVSKDGKRRKISLVSSI